MSPSPSRLPRSPEMGWDEEISLARIREATSPPRWDAAQSVVETYVSGFRWIDPTPVVLGRRARTIDPRRGEERRVVCWPERREGERD